MSNDTLKDILSDLKKAVPETAQYATIAKDGIPASDFSDFLDTGSYIMNALISTSIYGGIANGKITAIPGPEATGKTFIALSILNLFLKNNKDGLGIIFETESAITKTMLEERGIDLNRVLVIPVCTVEEFRTVCVRILNGQLALEKSKQKPIFMILDSLGQLSTSKEMNDTAEGKNTRDMTRAQLTKGAFRVITLKAAKVGIPLLVTNHIYSSMDQYSPDEQSGGTSIRYSASTIVFLSRKKEKDGTEVVGNVIHLNLRKSRIAREFMKVDTLLLHKSGLQRYYGLTELACEGGIFKKISTKVEAITKVVDGMETRDLVKDKLKELKVPAKRAVDTPDGAVFFDGDEKDGKRVAEWKEGRLFLLKTVFKNYIDQHPEEFFSKEVLDMIDKFAHQYFAYGSTIPAKGVAEDAVEESK